MTRASMRKPTRRSRRTGTVLFFIPILIVVALMVIGIVSYISNESGTLVVEAISSPRYSASVQLHVAVTVGSSSETTPFNLSLGHGTYTVSYGPKAWYITPNSKTLGVPGGRTLYAIGTYLPIIKVISISQGGLNVTSVPALHGVTPVVWVNNEGSAVLLQVDTFPGVYIQPSQNRTLVFPSQGRFDFQVFGSTFAGYVQVS